MKYTLLLALLAGGFSATAQSIAAGQTTGVRYTDIVPDRIASVTGPISSINIPVTAVDSLDLNLDGRYDIKWTAYLNSWSQSGRGGVDNRFSVLPLNSDVEIATSLNAPYSISCFGSQSIIANVLPQTSGANNTWGTSTNLWPAYRLIDFGSNPAGNFSYSSWPIGQDRYMGIRLRNGSAAPWVYGWVNIQVNTPPLNNPTITQWGFTATIKEYALGSNTLGNNTADETAWHAYPNPTQSSLTVTVTHKKTGTSEIKLLDTQGRVLHLYTIGEQQQTHSLDLSALPAGPYILQLNTAQGVITKLISKL